MFTGSIFVENVNCLIFFSVEAEASEHRGLAHVYFSIDGKVGNVSILCKCKVLELNLAVGAIYIKRQILSFGSYDALVMNCYPICISISLY